MDSRSRAPFGRRRRDPPAAHIRLEDEPPARIGKPLVLYALACRRQEHYLCTHATEQVSQHTRYFIFCTCACHADPRSIRRPPATAIDKSDPDPISTAIALDPQTRIAAARECHACHEKRAVVQWFKPTAYRGDYVTWQMCAPCLLGALQLIIGKQLKRGSRDEPRSRKTKGGNRS